MAGTSINPLLRAAYLSKAGYEITLMLPWLPPHEQVMALVALMTLQWP